MYYMSRNALPSNLVIYLALDVYEALDTKCDHVSVSSFVILTWTAVPVWNLCKINQMLNILCDYLFRFYLSSFNSVYNAAFLLEKTA